MRLWNCLADLGYTARTQVVSGTIVVYRDRIERSTVIVGWEDLTPTEQSDVNTALGTVFN